MYLYNISIIIEDASHITLTNWIQDTWIPRIEQDIRFLKMLDSPHEGHTYCIQLTTENKEEVDQFQQSYVSDLSQHIQREHKEKAFIFDSLMQYL